MTLVYVLCKGQVTLVQCIQLPEICYYNGKMGKPETGSCNYNEKICKPETGKLLVRDKYSVKTHLPRMCTVH